MQQVCTIAHNCMVVLVCRHYYHVTWLCYHDEQHRCDVRVCMLKEL